jgi:hypothetical protein
VEAATVTSGAPVLEAETSTIGTDMNGDVVIDLPLNVYSGRQAEYFAWRGLRDIRRSAIITLQ